MFWTVLVISKSFYRECNTVPELRYIMRFESAIKFIKQLFNKIILKKIWKKTNLNTE